MGDESAVKEAAALLPKPLIRLLTADGTLDEVEGAVFEGGDELLLRLYRTMAVVRAVDRQAMILTRQGQLAVYPSSLGQEAAQVGAALALSEQDWMFPTYRETSALVARGIPPVAAMPLFKGTWHGGWDPYRYRAMPHYTPIATQCLHAVGLARAAQLAGDDVVAMAFIGDGGTSEGDFHEALNFAAVYEAPVVFFVQNNQYAISVPVSLQTRAPTIAHKAVGYGMPGVRCDGNDVLATYVVSKAAVERARRGEGPTLIEAVTYRVEAHTTADDSTRYRTSQELEVWAQRDPISRLETFLEGRGLLDDAVRAEVAAGAGSVAHEFREAVFNMSHPHPMEMFDHVYVEPPPHYEEQREVLKHELEAGGS